MQPTLSASAKFSLIKQMTYLHSQLFSCLDSRVDENRRQPADTETLEGLTSCGVVGALTKLNI